MYRNFLKIQYSRYCRGVSTFHILWRIIKYVITKSEICGLELCSILSMSLGKMHYEIWNVPWIQSPLLIVKWIIKVDYKIWNLCHRMLFNNLNLVWITINLNYVRKNALWNLKFLWNPANSSTLSQFGIFFTFQFWPTRISCRV